MSVLSPLFALAVTALIGVGLFLAPRQGSPRGLRVFFVEPIKDVYALSELAVKATPLVLIALGPRRLLPLQRLEHRRRRPVRPRRGLRRRRGDARDPERGRSFVVLVLVAGMAGGMVWAAIVALLRDRFHASEILVSLMLVYVAELLLSYLVYGPWKDPPGYNFPQTITFASRRRCRGSSPATAPTSACSLALVAVGVFWVFIFRTYAGFQLQVGGLAPAAARYAGFSSRRALWTALLVSGGMAGLAGALEAPGRSAS